MAEKLTKTALKDELTRRIEWFEKAYKWTPDTGSIELEHVSHYVSLNFGRYRSLVEMRWQIEHGLFIGGFAA